MHVLWCVWLCFVVRVVAVFDGVACSVSVWLAGTPLLCAVTYGCALVGVGCGGGCVWVWASASWCVCFCVDAVFAVVGWVVVCVCACAVSCWLVCCVAPGRWVYWVGCFSAGGLRLRQASYPDRSRSRLCIQLYSLHAFPMRFNSASVTSISVSK